MSFENLENIKEPIETENQGEKEKALFEKIEQISLAYAEKKFQEIRKDHPEYKFSEAIRDFTPTIDIVVRPVYKLEGFHLDKYREKMAMFLGGFRDEIDAIYASDGLGSGRMVELVKAKNDSIKEYLGVDSLQERERGGKKVAVKILDFNQIVNIEKDAEGKYKDLEGLGFSQFDHFIEIHVEDFYRTSEKNLGPELIKNDLAVLAEYIIDQEPQTAAVIGKSWLLDTPLADRLGFKKIESDGRNEKQNDFSTWLQFVDKNGQIDQKRFSEFSETGELPYKSTKAYMPIEEFLQRYLPENRRGKIILKEVDNDRKDFWSKLQKEIGSVKADWYDLLKNNGDFDGFVQNNKALQAILGLVSPADRDEYLDFLKIMYDSDIPWSDFFEAKSENIRKIDKKINEAMKADLLKDKEVFIE